MNGAEKRVIKVIGINGSARKHGNTAIIINKVFEELNKEGIETELLHLADYEVHPCRGCFACKDRGNCVFTDDGFAQIFSSMIEADGIILGSPVYSADVSAKMKAFLERSGVVVATNPGLLRHKIGASVAAVRRGGGMTTVDTMNHFMLNKEMIVVGSTYWNMVFGANAKDTQQDLEGASVMRAIASNMVWLLKLLEKAKGTELEKPVLIDKVKTNFIR